MLNQRLSVLMLLMLLSTSFLLAQDDERDLPKADENFHKYLDDGQNTGANADLKIAVSSLVVGHLTVQYEQKITNSISVEAGGSYQIFDGIDIPNLLFNDYYEPNGTLESGYGYTGAIKYYAGQSAITNLGYASLVYRNRTSNYDGLKFTQNDIYYSTGIKSLFMNTLSADISSGIGARIFSLDYDGTNSDENGLGFFYGFEVKLGYYIKY